jgi:hypothetical protein
MTREKPWSKFGGNAWLYEIYEESKFESCFCHPTLHCIMSTPKVGESGKRLTNPRLGGKGWLCIIPFVRKHNRFCRIYIQSFPVEIRPNKQFVIEGWWRSRRNSMQDLGDLKGGIKNYSFRRKRTGFITLQGIPSSHDDFRPLLAGILILWPFRTTCGIFRHLWPFRTTCGIFRHLLFIVRCGNRGLFLPSSASGHKSSVLYRYSSLVPVVSHLRISLHGNSSVCREIKTERQRVSRDLAVRRVVLPGWPVLIKMRTFHNWGGVNGGRNQFRRQSAIIALWNSITVAFLTAPHRS